MLSWGECIMYIWKIKNIQLYTWNGSFHNSLKTYLLIGIWATLNTICIQFLSIIFIEHYCGQVHSHTATGAVSSHLWDLLYVCSRCYLFSFPWNSKTHVYLFLYNSSFIVHCTFPLYFSKPEMSCLIWIDKNRTLCSKWNPTREMYYSHHYRCLRHRENLPWMLF